MTIRAALTRFGVFTLVFGCPAVLNAQTPLSPPTLAIPGSIREPQLSDALRAVVRDPMSANALVEAGKKALEVGDANAEIGFFGRASELAPSDYRPKSGLGSALLLLEKPRQALQMFKDAEALGAPSAELAADRGLAFDLNGEQQRAQVEYGIALSHSPTDEVIRRYALSLGISGNKSAALARIAPLVEKNDQAAWRARTFILAMNGEVEEAERIVFRIAPPDVARSLMQFLQMLASQNPSAKAHAVHFGSLPSVATSSPLDPGEVQFRPLDANEATLLAQASAALKVPVTEPVAPADPRDVRRLEREQRRIERERASRPQSDTATQIAASRRTSLINQPTLLAVDVSKRPQTPQANTAGDSLPKAVEAVSNPAPRSASAGTVMEAPPPSAGVSNVPDVTYRPPVEAPTLVTPPVAAQAQPVIPISSDQSSMASGSKDEVRLSPPMPAPVAKQMPTGMPTGASFTPASSGLAAIVASLQLEQPSVAAPLPDEARQRALKLEAQRKAALADKEKAAKAIEQKRFLEEQAKLRRNPARIWVQVATGRNTSGLPYTWRQLQSAAPKSLAGQNAWVVAYGQSKRLLVGPYPSSGYARTVIEGLKKEGVQSLLFSSEAGQEIDRLGSN